MTPQSALVNERFAGTYRKLFDTIERGGDQCSVDRLQTLIAEKTKNLSLGLDAYGVPSSQSRSKITQSVSMDGKTIKLDPSEKELIIQATDFLHLNELACVSVWTAYKQQQQQQQPKLDDAIQREHTLVRLTEFYNEDRIALLQCIASLLRIAGGQDDHVFVSIAQDTVKQIVNDEFAERLLKQLKERVRAPIPSQHNTSTWQANEWAKQNLREQRGLLEVLLLIYYFKPCPPKYALALLQEFEASSFGQQQAFGHVLDNDGMYLRDQVSHLGVLLSVESLNLDSFQSSPAAATTTTIRGEHSLYTKPDIVYKMCNVVAYLGEQPEHSVFLLAWSFVLNKIDNELIHDEDDSQTYVTLQQFIHGQMDISSSSLLTDRPTTRDTTTTTMDREPSIKTAPQIYRLYAGRAIKLAVFDHMQKILNNRLCDDEEANSLAYHDTLKNVISSFLSTIDPIHLPNESYTSLIQCTCKLFENQSMLAARFWMTSNTDSIASLISTSRMRFPLAFQDLTQLLSATTGSSKEAKDIVSEEPAKRIFHYLETMPTLTVMLKDLSKVTQEEQGDETGIVVRATHPIRITEDFAFMHGFVIPPGTTGSLLSSPEEQQQHIVQWHVDYSCWHLFVAVLAGFIKEQSESGYNNNTKGKSDDDLSKTDIRDIEAELSGKNMDVVNTILDLIQRILQVSPSLATDLVEHIERVPGRPGPYPSKVLVTLLCQLLNVCCLAQKRPVATITATMRCLTALLPYYRDAIWSYFQQSPILPWSNASYTRSAQAMHVDPSCQIQHIVTNYECKTGKYSLLLAFLDLVTGLVRDVQHKWWESGNEQNQRQIEVLYFCLHYLMIDVFPSYAHWRYKHLSERFLIGCKVLTIFIEITQYFRDPAGAAAATTTTTTAASGSSSPVLTLGALREQIMNGFLYDGGIYHVTPLLDTVRNGTSLANTLYHANRDKEAERAERMTELTFVFIKLLLQRRLETIESSTRSATPLPTRYESALERFMLERSTDGNSPDLLLRLMNHIDYTPNIQLSILATDIVTLLCRGLSAWKTTPNFVRHLGDKDQAQNIIKRYLSTAQDQTQNEHLLASIWQMLTLLMETQPSLAILFLECGEYIMPSPKSAVRLLPSSSSSSEQQQQGGLVSLSSSTPAVRSGSAASSSSAAAAAASTESATRAAVDLLSHWEMLSVEKPTVLSNVLRFLATFWQTAFEHYALVQRQRSDSALWDALGKILLNPTQLEEPNSANLKLNQGTSSEEQGLQQQQRPTVASDGNEVVRRICCANISKAFVMRIMAFEMQLTAGAEQGNNNKPLSSSALVEKLPAGLKALLTKVSDPNKLAAMRAAFVKNSYDAQLDATMNKDALRFVNDICKCDKSGVGQLLNKVDVVGFGDNDGDGEPRQYGDCYVYDLRLAYSRAQSALKQYSAMYNVEIDKEEEMIVTPEVYAVRKAKNVINRFLVDVCAVNHNWSIVDTQMIAVQSFKVFMETCSTYTGELIWKSSNTMGGGGNGSSSGGPVLQAGTLFDFLSGLTQQANDERREDNVTLSYYSVLIGFIRDLTEDWIAANRQVLGGVDRQQKRQLADKLFALLETYCGLLRRDNYALMDSISDQSAHVFHRPLLEAILLPLRSLRRVYTSVTDFKDAARLKGCLSQLLEVTCDTFQMMVYKVASYSCTPDLSDHANEECVKDMTVVTGLLNELIHPNFHSGPEQWLSTFRRCETIPSLLKLIHGGIDLAVSEVNRPLDANSSVDVSPYAENGLYLLLALSSIPDVAAALVNDGVLELFCNNALSPLLKQGQLDMFLRFGDQAGYVERNPLHSIWCHMLCVVSNILRSLGSSSNSTNRPQLTEKVFRGTVAFLQVYGTQIDRTFSLVNGGANSLFGLLPSESLSSCLLEEVDRISMIIYNLSRQLERIMSFSAGIFIPYKNSVLTLLLRFLYFYTHPAHMQAQLYPINETERLLAETIVSPSSNEPSQQQQASSSSSSSSSSASSSSGAAATTTEGMQQSRLMRVIVQKTIRIQRNILATFILLTQADLVMTKPEPEWPFGNTIFYPNLRTQDTASFATLSEGVTSAVGFIKESKDNTNAILRELLATVEGSLVLLTTQAALWISKPDMGQEVQREIIDNTLVEITALLTKTYRNLNATTLPMALKDQKERTLLQIAALKRFLAERYFTV
ncbi:nucleoporin subcomplex protein binding to Pom34-domain-containing protein [Zychaea mexicana]|uniref:nucleoporin subcomplex protein binding to Pom34-domain-containing protein n=1 Tax=Zychaea mexicana TaxID=64656 RepID=UPI0022FE2101|nr:nucleoporin subcomplex protein binding to Pom34-domain-containing protein [Zychaea mexicana]KAI9488711.1 nucleoporin subcomplex protein binding to Pom34-domain-containing protein [Zychaea mexicana]